MLLLATRDTWWMRQCEAALLAEGIDLRWEPAGHGSALCLDVAASEVERAADVLSEQLGEDMRKARSEVRSVPRRLVPLVLQPAFVVGMGLAVLTLVFFWITGPAASGSWWFRAGALVTSEAQAGQWWRLVTASTLHADAAHAVGNAGFFLVLGWGAAERLGGGATAMLWLLSAVAGFVVSLVFDAADVTVGASGGLFGLLGVAAGHAMMRAADHVAELERRRQRLRAFGAGVMLLGFTAFSARANIHAHVGGFFAGMFLGFVAPREALRPWAQGLLGIATLGIILGAWFLTGP